MITKTETDVISECICARCCQDLFDQKCIVCGATIFYDWSDYGKGFEVWCIDDEDGHCCSQKCADAYIQKKKEEVKEC